MKKLFKTFVPILISAVFIMSVLTIAVSASHMDFGETTTQKHINEYTKVSWDTPKLSNNGVKGASSQRDVFSQFGYVQNSSSCNGVRFIEEYGKVMGVYTPDNDYDEFDVYWAATFDDELLKRIKLGQIEIKIEADTRNANGTFNQETGRLSLKGYKSDKTSETFDYYSLSSKCDGTRHIASGWTKIPSDTKYLRINAWSERDGLNTQRKNRSAVYNIRVYLRDITPPKPIEAGIVQGDYYWNKIATQKNSAGNEFKVAVPGNQIKYYVKFNEEIKVSNYDKQFIKLRIQNRGGSATKDFYADYSSVSGDTMYFLYTVTDNTDCVTSSKDTSLSPTGATYEIIHKGFTDTSGNCVATNKPMSVLSLFKTASLRIDDIKTGFAKDMSDENGYFPAKYTRVPTGGIVYGSFPDDLKGTTAKTGSGNPNLQPTLAGPDTPLYFRIVVDDEIQKSMLNENTKLKVVLSKNRSTPFTHMQEGDVFGYANLVCARILGSNNGSSNHYGIKNNVVTEMFFKYVHDKNDRYLANSTYTVYPAFDAESYIPSQSVWCNVKSLENDGLFLQNNGAALRTTSGNEVKDLFISQLKTGVVPKIDCRPPELVAETISEEWNTKLSVNSKLEFYDDSGISNDGVTISVVQYDNSGNKHALPIIMPGSGAGYSYVVPVMSSVANVGGLQLADTLAGKQNQLYLEYTLKDKAGNETNNYGSKNLPVYLDNAPPEVTYKDGNYSVNGNYATVNYNIKDYGIGEISPVVYYKIEAMGMFGNIPHTENKTTYKYSNHGVIDFNGVQGTRELWRVWASYADTLGNRAVDDKGQTVYTPSEPIELATRTLKMFSARTSEMVSDEHNVKVWMTDEPSTDYTVELYYKWVNGSQDKDSVKYRCIDFTDASEIEEINFADEEIIKQFVNYDTIYGEYTFFAYAKMLPENAYCYNLTATVYFDKYAPSISTSVTTSNPDRYASEVHYISYDITDDGGNYKNGIYTDYRNIKFAPAYTYPSEVVYPKLNIYIDDELVRSVNLTNLTGTYVSNVKDDFISTGNFKGARYISYEITAEDNFGHETTKDAGFFYMDATHPELTDIEVEFKNGSIYKYDEENGYYIVNDLADIKSFSTTITDNFSGNLTVTHRKNGSLKHFTSAVETDKYDYTYTYPVKSDFSQELRNGRWVFEFSFDGEDAIGNFANTKSIYFLVDRVTPIISGRLPSYSISEKGRELTIDLKYTADSYEQFEDFTVEIDGEGARFSHVELGYITVIATQNTTIELTVSDSMGKSDTKTYEIDWYDETPPVIHPGAVQQTPAEGAAKYGEIKFNVTDETYIGTVMTAIVPEGEVPGEDDYFDGNIDNEYFGDSATEYTEAELSKIAGGYVLEYKSIPNGTYDIYAIAYDSCSNNSGDVLIAQITTTTEGAKLVSGPTYTPDTLTGGDVTANIKTDIPTARIYDIDGDGSIAAMQEAVAEARFRGFSFVRDGAYHFETEFDAINALYEELMVKDEYELTPEEKEIFKGYNSGSSYDPYAGVLDPENTYQYITPYRDVLDFLHNEAFYPIEDTYEGYDLVRTVNEGTRLVNIADSYVLDTEALAKAGFVNDDETGIEVEDVGLYTMNVLTYPTRFDESSYGEYSPSLYEDYLICVNPFYGEILPEEFIYENFGADVDLSIFEHEEGSDEYFFPIASDNPTVTELTEAGFGAYIELFSTEEYRNPFVEDGENLTEEDIIAILKAIDQLKQLRKTTATIVADRYCQFYLNNVNQSYSTSHNLRFKYNTDKNVKFMDKTGQEISVPIKIDWIDPSLPHVPFDKMKLEVIAYYDYGDGDAWESVYEPEGSVSLTPEPEYGIVDKKLRLTVDLTSYKENEEVDIYDQYYILNLPEGAVGEETYSELYDGLPIYDKFVLDITENGIVRFDVINPSVINDATKKYIAPQIYVVDCIDSEPPAATLEYFPEKPIGGKAFVNTDVTVKVADLTDNISAGYEIHLDYDEMYKVNEIDELPDELYDENKFTFTENGEFIFVISDKVGNKTYLPAKVDYIDKSPVDIDLKLLYDGGEVEISDISEENTDPKIFEKVYTVTDERHYGKDLKIKAYVNGELIAEDVVLVGDDSWSVEYEGPSGNIGKAYISGFKFDTQPPEASVSYEIYRPGKGVKSYAEATILLFDENVAELSVISVNGHTDEHEFTLSDAVMDYSGVEGEPAKVRVRFNGNGYADVKIADAVGNTTTVQLSVSDLDRTAPTATVQYSKKTPTKESVDAVFMLSEPADYQLYDINGNIIRDYAGTYTNYFTYTFNENSTVFLRFTDDDGNESEGFAAGVTNIDRDAPVLAVKEIHKNKAVDMEGNMVTYYGAATIELEVVSSGDTLKGTDEDTIVLVGTSQSLFHTVMENDTYIFTYSDLAGNMAKLSVEVDVIDDTLPTATISGNPTEWTNVAPVITITANDKEDGSPSYVVMNGAEYKTVTFTAVENGDVSYVLRDTSNNSASATVEVRFVDIVAPSIEFEGNKDIYVLPGEFDKDSFEAVDYYDNADGSGITSDGLVITYPDSFDANVPGVYDVTFSVCDIAGNTASLVRKITVLSEEDVYAVINGTVLIPDSMTTFWNGEELELSFLNAEKQGNKLSYAFESGYFMAAEMKGTPYKYLTTPDAKISLDAETTGMYTLFVQTEDRKMMVMYIFIAGN